MNPFLSLVSGIASPIVDLLKSVGVIKDPEAELHALTALRDMELRLGEQANTALETINATMREEAKSEHWMQWSWRPLVGYTFCAVILNNYLLLPYFQNMGLLPIAIPDTLWTVMLVVLGVTAGTRGWKQVVEAGKG